MTKSKIVERLLEEKQITAEEAVTLLMGEKEYVYVSQPYPVYGYVTPYVPYTITYDTTSSITLNSESK